MTTYYSHNDKLNKHLKENYEVKEDELGEYFDIPEDTTKELLEKFGVEDAIPEGGRPLTAKEREEIKGDSSMSVWGEIWKDYKGLVFAVMLVASFLLWLAYMEGGR